VVSGNLLAWDGGFRDDVFGLEITTMNKYMYNKLLVMEQSERTKPKVHRGQISFHMVNFACNKASYSTYWGWSPGYSESGPGAMIHKTVANLRGLCE
jgi:hypothetical protein